MPQKVTSHQLTLQREAEQRQLEEAAKEKEKAKRREVSRLKQPDSQDLALADPLLLHRSMQTHTLASSRAQTPTGRMQAPQPPLWMALLSC